MDPDRIDYPRIVQDALRDAVRRVLEQAAEHGVPGEHQLYIAFRTQHPQAKVPPFLRDQYPEEVTIVLQHQYWDLEVTAEAFSVTLNFNAVRQRLTVPFAAMTAFFDPAAEFALRFEPNPGEAAATEAPAAAEPAPEAPRPAPAKPGEVIRFDPSRRK
ncbi:MAG TPA: ClpXP protease specificity-enhancing factor SspB [Thermoanaerobaculia bacterium]|nr:ClpXP protease specificity-enhancing factor SspB [Thermoanaerobaculia bacterium]